MMLSGQRVGVAPSRWLCCRTDIDIANWHEMFYNSRPVIELEVFQTIDRLNLEHVFPCQNFTA